MLGWLSHVPSVSPCALLRPNSAVCSHDQSHLFFFQLIIQSWSFRSWDYVPRTKTKQVVAIRTNLSPWYPKCLPLRSLHNMIGWPWVANSNAFVMSTPRPMAMLLSLKDNFWWRKLHWKIHLKNLDVLQEWEREREIEGEKSYRGVRPIGICRAHHLWEAGCRWSFSPQCAKCIQFIKQGGCVAEHSVDLPWSFHDSTVSQ